MSIDELYSKYEPDNAFISRADIERCTQPWTPEFCERLNDYQAAGEFHPYTCGNDSRHALLVATEAGWHCPDCDYRQYWALTPPPAGASFRERTRRLGLRGALQCEDAPFKYGFNRTGDK